MTSGEITDHVYRQGLLQLLEIKDSDVRMLTLMQGRDAVDKGIHIGGAFSAVIPLVSLFYGGIIRVDVERPTRVGQDVFVLSKGHAVASMASIYADLGYFDASVLKGSRSAESILNGHPGPLLPGVHVSTGPEGHGMPVAQGFALAGRQTPPFDVYCITGDGEMQAGMIWEAAMHAGARRLDNLCVLVDKNEGQLDNPRSLQFPMPQVDRMLESFGWRVFDVDGTQYGPVLGALEVFRHGERDGRPTAIICNTRKGWGGFSSFMVGHKVELPDALTRQELGLQQERRAARAALFLQHLSRVEVPEARHRLLAHARLMRLDVDERAGEVRAAAMHVLTRKAAPREKRVPYDESSLPRLEVGQETTASAVITQAMKVFAASGMVVSVDADLGTTSGLEAGVGYADQGKALNVGVAESNMSCIGEAFAVLGYNTWVSTFCPFFDWRVLRRIAINFQERKEAIAAGSWLSEGHNVDLTFLATASNFETRTNGATHMGNDDAQVFGQIAHIRIVDTCCPNQVLAVMKWIMEGNRGLLYLRVMRASSAVLYPPQTTFEFGKGTFLRGDEGSIAFIVSSGRGVHEALQAATMLESSAINLGVVDMPSLDEILVLKLCQSGKPLLFAEQNNGFLWSQTRDFLFRSPGTAGTGRLIPINTLDASGRPQFIHSATYQQLLEIFGLSPDLLAGRVRQLLR
ncbi:MAG: transketolase C-terminal domain-containing protein [Spirochaetia bacterium]